MKMKTNKQQLVILMLLVIPHITIVTTAMTQTAKAGYRVDLTAMQLLH
jgi:hypothetical protein